MHDVAELFEAQGGRSISGWRVLLAIQFLSSALTILHAKPETEFADNTLLGAGGFWYRVSKHEDG